MKMQDLIEANEFVEKSKKKVSARPAKQERSAINTVQSLFDFLLGLSSQYFVGDRQIEDYKIKETLYSVLLNQYVVVDIELDKLSSFIQSKIEGKAISAISAMSVDIENNIETNTMSAISAMSADLETKIEDNAISTISAAMDKLSVVFKDPTPEEMAANPNVFFFVADKEY